MFLLGRQATLGHAPPSNQRSTTAVRRPAPAIVQATNLPDPPLPITRFSNFSMLDIGLPPQAVRNCRYRRPHVEFRRSFGEVTKFVRIGSAMKERLSLLSCERFDYSFECARRPFVPMPKQENFRARVRVCQSR